MQGLSRTLTLGGLAGAAGLVGLIAGSWLVAPGAGVESLDATLFATPRPVPEFELLDQRGEAFTRAELEGGWNLLFFGFTHCPDVCPMTLNVLAHLGRQLGEDTTAPTVVFVSVDPERDTVEEIATYVEYFDPNFVGVTGDAAGIDDFAAQLGVAHGRTPTRDGDGYTVDHTAALFLVNPDADLVAIFTPPHDVRRIARDLAIIMPLHEGRS